VTPYAVHALDLLRGGRFVTLTGAGISTDSGIPDYRGPRPAGTPPVRMPMTYQDFLASTDNRRRYWARAHVGWSRMTTAAPNRGHRLLAGLTRELVITQNVDGLHRRAGQHHLIELHGRISDVRCLDCDTSCSRTAVQEAMILANPGYAAAHAGSTVRPDGDVELDETHDFVVPLCPACGGRLKPDVVFFGENVPRDRVARCIAAVEATEALLVLGSSLTVMSGFRFVRQARKRGIPVVIVNRGTTRGDDLATVKLDLGVTELLEDLVGYSERNRIVEDNAASFSTTGAGTADSTSMTA
jgi:NAD-dependent SIR2 family protein deacetylase